MSSLESCPNCGHELEPDAESCPGCGSCAETGWNERAYYQNIGIDYDAEEEFDYDNFTQNEFGQSKPPGIQGRPKIFSWLAIGITILLVLYLIIF